MEENHEPNTAEPGSQTEEAMIDGGGQPEDNQMETSASGQETTPQVESNANQDAVCLLATTTKTEQEATDNQLEPAVDQSEVVMESAQQPPHDEQPIEEKIGQEKPEELMNVQEPERSEPAVDVVQQCESKTEERPQEEEPVAQQTASADHSSKPPTPPTSEAEQKETQELAPDQSEK